MPLDDISKIRGGYHIADNPQLYEPARTNNFVLLVHGLEDLVAAGVDPNAVTDEDIIQNAQETLAISVISSSVPHFELSQIDVKEGNNTVHFAGTPTFNNQTIKCNDYIGARTKDILLAWKALAYDVQSQKVNLARNYKKTCQLIEYSPDYDEVIRITDIYGAWCRSVTEGDFDTETNNKREVSAEIVYDYAVPRRK